ncbi:hypothetical protein PQX77_006675 [Marasmius sp. AFHP31]|nr:hypothetical protein PQX77_006675 [Marasmius sp. AFHP31]
MFLVLVTVLSMLPVKVQSLPDMGGTDDGTLFRPDRVSFATDISFTQNGKPDNAPQVILLTVGLASVAQVETNACYVESAIRIVAPPTLNAEVAINVALISLKLAVENSVPSPDPFAVARMYAYRDLCAIASAGAVANRGKYNAATPLVSPIRFALFPKILIGLGQVAQRGQHVQKSLGIVKSLVEQPRLAPPLPESHRLPRGPLPLRDLRPRMAVPGH